MKKVLLGLIIGSQFTTISFAQMRTFNTVAGGDYYSNFGLKFFTFFNSEAYETCLKYYISPQSKINIDSLKQIHKWLDGQIPAYFLYNGYSETSSQIISQQKYYEKTYYKWANSKIEYYCQIRLDFDSSGRISKITLFPKSKITTHDSQIRKVEKQTEKHPNEIPPPPPGNGK